MKSRPVSPVLVGLLVVLFSSIFIVMGTRGLYRDFQFDGNVGRSTATIVQLKAFSSGRGTTHYEATYSFVAGNVGVIESSSQVAPGTYYRLHQGDQVPIKYLFDQPKQTCIDELAEVQWHWQQDETGLGVGLFFASIGLIIAWCGRKWKAPEPT